MLGYLQWQGHKLTTSSTNSTAPTPATIPGPSPYSEDSVIELSRGAAFALVTSIALALVYHPASGSLIFGPTNRFWILSPVASVADSFAILVRLGGWPLQKCNLPFFHKETSKVSNELTFRNAAYSILIARALNASITRREGFESRTEHDSYIEELRLIGSEIDEGKRFRLGIALPILGQFVKILAMRNVYFLKILGYTYFVHWVIIELLISVAKPKRKYSFTASESTDILARIDELLFLPRNCINDLEGGQNVEGDTRAGSEGCTHYNTMFDDLFWRLYCVLFLLSLGVNNVYFQFRSEYIVGAQLVLFPFTIYATFFICPDLRHALTAADRESSETIPRNDSNTRVRSAPMPAPLTHVGGDGGIMFFIAWTIWCGLCFDGKGTQRPDWPWLDWLG